MTPSEDPRPLNAGVCGYPIGHSKSPILFRYWFHRYGIDGNYLPLRIAPEDFFQVLPALKKAGFRGVNCTLPHKVMALEIADTLTDTARIIGAANTLTFSPDGKITADNSDWFGFLQNVRIGHPEWDPASGPAVVLGASGAARGGIHALLHAGCQEIRVSNRTRERAEELAAFFGPKLTVIDWNQRSDALAEASIIVNSTSLGMTGEKPLEISLDAAPKSALVTDMVYNPLSTDLLLGAARRGMPIVDGLGMLLHQARPGFLSWFGLDPEVTDDLRAACLRDSA